MLTKTQKDWAAAQVGEERDGVVTGKIVAAHARGKEGFILDVVGDNGTASLSVQASDQTITEMRKNDITVRVEGTVTAVQYDEENGRVGLEISGESGTTTDWVVPEMSDEEEEAQELAIQAEQNQVEAQNREIEKAEFKNRVLTLITNDAQTREANFKPRLLDLINNDEDIRAAIQAVMV